MQHGVFGEIHKNGQAVTLAGAQHDQVAADRPRYADDFGLDAADLHPLMVAVDTDVGTQRNQPLARG